MIDADEMLWVARRLATGLDVGDASLRRAVSTAYYALFHILVGSAGSRFAGRGSSAVAYNLVYRSLDHARIRNVLREVNRPRLTELYRKMLARDTTSDSLRKFADRFLRMQALRQSADYDPDVVFTQADVDDLIDEAEAAVAIFRKIEEAELSDILTLMLVGGRTQQTTAASQVPI